MGDLQIVNRGCFGDRSYVVAVDPGQTNKLGTYFHVSEEDAKTAKLNDLFTGKVKAIVVQPVAESKLGVSGTIWAVSDNQSSRMTKEEMVAEIRGYAQALGLGDDEAKIISIPYRQLNGDDLRLYSSFGAAMQKAHRLLLKPEAKTEAA